MVDLGARRRLVGDDGFVDSVAIWAWMLFSLWWRAFYFSLGTHFKFRRENCTIIRQVGVVGLDAIGQGQLVCQLLSCRHGGCGVRRGLWVRPGWVQLGS